MSLKNIKKAFIFGMLLSSLAVLPGCLDWIKEKFGSCESTCTTCGDHGMPQGKLTGEALLSVDGQPLVTVATFEDFWKMYVESNPQAALIAGFYPGLRKEVFNSLLVPFEIAKVYLQKTGKDKSADLKKLYERQCEFVYKTLALDILQKDILAKIDKSPKALKDFYEQNRDKIKAFQDNKFTKVAGATSALSVEFDSAQDAEAFLEKAKTGDFAKLAKEAGKELKDLGFVTMENPDVNYFIKVKLNELKPAEVTKVDLGKDKFVVVKAIEKRNAEYSPFESLDQQTKDIIERELVQVKGVEKMKSEMENLKKTYNIQQNNAFFDEELEKKQAELAKMQKDLENLNEDVEAGEKAVEQAEELLAEEK